jgi:hypothetical protein
MYRSVWNFQWNPIAIHAIYNLTKGKIVQERGTPKKEASRA